MGIHVGSVAVMADLLENVGVAVVTGNLLAKNAMVKADGIAKNVTVPVIARTVMEEDTTSAKLVMVQGNVVNVRVKEKSGVLNGTGRESVLHAREQPR